MKKVTDKERLDWLGENDKSFILAIPGLWWIFKNTIGPLLVWMDRDYIDAAIRAQARASKRRGK